MRTYYRIITAGRWSDPVAKLNTLAVRTGVELTIQTIQTGIIKKRVAFTVTGGDGAVSLFKELLQQEYGD
jgi:hypothetical protein